MGEDTTFDEINQKITTTLNLRHCAGIRATVVDILLAIHCSDDAEGRKGFLRLHTAGRQTCAVLVRGNKACLWSTRLDLHVLFDVAKHRVERLVLLFQVRPLFFLSSHYL